MELAIEHRIDPGRGQPLFAARLLQGLGHHRAALVGRGDRRQLDRLGRVEQLLHGPCA